MANRAAAGRSAERWRARLLPLADLYMGLMLSRPNGLSLRDTRVTTPTIWLSAGVFLALGLPGIGLTAFAILASRWVFILPGLVALLLGMGALVLAVYGLLQRGTR